jgi:glycosyltransferase involved in cell wall biosynthesis
MRELARMGHRALLFTSNSNHLVSSPAVEGTHLTRTIDGVEVTWIRTRQYRGAKSLGRILSWLDFEWRLWRLPKHALPPPDAVIVSSLSLLTIFNGLLLRRRYGCRLVFEVRDIWPLTIVEEGNFSPRNPFVAALAMVERLAYRRSDAIVGLMPTLEEHVREVAGPRTAPVHCIPIGYDPAIAEAADPLAEGYADAHIPNDRFVVCHAGTIGLTNALETLLECARTMRDREDVHFLVVGEGELKPRYEAEFGDLANLTFAPAVPKTAVQALLRRCDLLYFAVHPSKVWRYGQALNKVIDYMLAGKPIVASYSGYPSMIDESGGGELVPAADVAALRQAIERLADKDSGERAAIGAAAREWILRNRSYPRLAEQYLALALPRRAG